GATASVGIAPSLDGEPGPGPAVSLVAGAVELRDADSGEPVDGDVELAVGLEAAVEGELTTLVDATTVDGHAVGLIDASGRGGTPAEGAETTAARVTASAGGYAPVDDAIELPAGADLPVADGTLPSGPVASGALTVDLAPEPEPEPEPAPEPEPERGDAEVTVTDDRGEPLAGATVVLADEGGPVTETTADADGRAVFADLPTGRYTATASAAAHEAATIGDLPVAAEGETSRTLALTRLPGSLEVTVVDARSGAALDGAGLVVAPDEDHADTARAEALELDTDVGEARAEGLPAGAYRVRLDAEGYEPTQAEAVVAPGETASVRLEAVGDPPPLVVEVTDTDGAPVPGAAVTASGTASTVITLADRRSVTVEGETDADGRAVLRDAPPGAYRITVTREGFRSWQGAHTLEPATASPVTARLEPDAVPPAEPEAGAEEEPASDPAREPGAEDGAPAAEPGTDAVEHDTSALATPGPSPPATGGSAAEAGADPDPAGTPVPAPAAERLAGLPPPGQAPTEPSEAGAAPRRGSSSAASGSAPAPGPAPEATEVLLANAVGAFGSSLPTVAHGPANPARVAANTGLAALLAFLLILPAELFNATLRENYDRVVGRLGRVRHAGRALLDRVAALVPQARLVGGATLTVVVAAAASALDPRFGGGMGSLRLMAAQTVGLLVTTYAVSAIALVAARRGGTPASMAFRPAALLVVVVVVLVSRAVDLSPGFLYGFVAAAVFHERVTITRLGRITLLQGVFMVGTGVGAWLLLAPAQLAAAAGGFLPALAAEALTAVAVGTLTSLVLAFVPLTFTHGERLFAWSRRAWLAVYASGLFAFLSIAVNPVFGQLSATRSLGVAIGAYATFTLGSIAFWLALRRRADAPHERLTRPVSHPPQ
ncbi:MAG: FGLLP motif-containing membrane protein, partial [Egibacteraceae bacterium]